MSRNLLWINSSFTEGFQRRRCFALFGQRMACQEDWLKASMFLQIALWENLVLRKSDHISSLFTVMALTFHGGAVNLRRTLLLWDNRSGCHTTLFLCSLTTTTGREEVSPPDSLPNGWMVKCDSFSAFERFEDKFQAFPSAHTECKYLINKQCPSEEGGAEVVGHHG